MSRELDHDLTVMADPRLGRPLPALRPERSDPASLRGFADTHPLPPFARGDVTRLATRINGEAVKLSRA